MPDDAGMRGVRSKIKPEPAGFQPHVGGDLTRIVDAAPVGMVLLLGDGKAIYANRAFAEMTGHAPDADNPVALDRLVHPEDETAVRLQFDRLVRREKTTCRGEHRFRHIDGAPLWVMMAASLLPAEGVQPDLVILQLTSIELQKRAEEALAYSEARWNSALESARQGVWDYDLRRDRMFYSRMWRRLRGMEDDEEIGANHDTEWRDRIHPEDRERVIAAGKKQGQGEQGYDTLQYRERTRDGRYIWILSRGKPIEWDEDGRVIRSVGTDTDITHLKTIEQELAAEKERLRVTLESIADGVIATDDKGNIVFVNAVAEQLLGCVAADVTGMASTTVFVLQDADTGWAQVCPGQTCIAQRRVVDAGDNLVLARPDGSKRDIRCTAAPVIMPDGTISGSVLVFQDVTQSRAIQRQLAHSATHDALTGLTNRGAFEQSLDTALVEARRGRLQYALLYADLDHFKPVNDTAGHSAGDALLKQIAATLRDSCRSHDLVARIGGDEFAMLLEGCSLEGARRVADKIVKATKALVFSWAGRDYSIGISIGITLVSDQPASPLGFMGEADAACYAAKGKGRGQVVVFSEMIGQSTAGSAQP
jgi:diguanylate cyclase (GGDEF)-like protein/PAS domain S-box-containing protein